MRTVILIATLLFSAVSAFGQDDQSKLLVGKWTKAFQDRTVTFTLSADNKFEVEFTGDDKADVLGSYVTSGTKLTLTDEGGDYSSGSSGIYEFKVSDSSLTLTEVDDPVEGRSMVTSGSWSKAR
jgi:hypothetical protein